MPIYEYRCRACGAQKEYLQKMSDAPLTDCPECGRAELEKMVSAAGFQLKGSGWYATDFKSGGQSKAKTDSGSGDKAKPSEQLAAKSESKADSSSTKSDTGKTAATSGAGAGGSS
jgi:putative FmdB family regulatory protein